MDTWNPIMAQTLAKPEPVWQPSRFWTITFYVLALMLAAWITQGCDGEAAQVTAHAEQDAYENYLNAQAAARYRPTLQPIKASTVEVTLTVCQQYEEVNRKWICYGVSQ